MTIALPGAAERVAYRWARGAAGERMVGEILEGLGPEWHLIHGAYRTAAWRNESEPASPTITPLQSPGAGEVAPMRPVDIAADGPVETRVEGDRFGGGTVGLQGTFDLDLICFRLHEDPWSTFRVTPVGTTIA